ncbi:MAG: hypothetical protein GX998_04820 [Firmicutes bacterium]|nr:hypothetical protein [Bacillota bacterium]
MRRLSSLLLCAVIACCIALLAGSVVLAAEAPILTGLVEQGKLPPVDQRLPEEPAVVQK